MKIQHPKMLELTLLLAVSQFLAACDNDDAVIPALPPPPPPPAMASFDVTVTNLTNAQPLSPIAVIAHQSGYSLFSVGSPATTGLEEMAEGGDNSTLLAEADADAMVTATGSGAAPVGPAGSETVTIDLLVGLIQRVLENLVRNAIRFTPDGGEVTISITERPRSVSVSVSDTGPGIPTEEIPRIFDRFYRAVQGEEARSDSSGLGLAIVKRILDLHDSRITVVSKIDAGTRFEFELPLIDRAA